MPARSTSQQRLFGLIHSCQKGEQKAPSAKIKHLAKSISPTDVTHFAATKHQGLPEKQGVALLGYLAGLKQADADMEQFGSVPFNLSWENYRNGIHALKDSFVDTFRKGEPDPMIIKGRPAQKPNPGFQPGYTGQPEQLDPGTPDRQNTAANMDPDWENQGLTQNYLHATPAQSAKIPNFASKDKADADAAAAAAAANSGWGKTKAWAGEHWKGLAAGGATLAGVAGLVAYLRNRKQKQEQEQEREKLSADLRLVGGLDKAALDRLVTNFVRS